MISLCLEPIGYAMEGCLPAPSTRPDGFRLGRRGCDRALKRLE